MGRKASAWISNRWTQASVLMLAALLPALAQDALRVDVNLVSVFLTVHNPDGTYLSGLSAGDFRVYEDDVEQRIEIFETGSVDSAVGVLLDNSGSMVDILPMMKSGLIDFARKNRDSDDLFVMTFGTMVRLIHDVNEPLSALPGRLDGVRARGTSLMFDALVGGMRKIQESGQPRKALVVFTDGNDNASTAGFGVVLREAQRSGVLLYFIPIGARVLVDENTIEPLGAATGGRVIYLRKEDPVTPAFESIREELSRQYYLGYYAPRRPGFHRIRVELPGRPAQIRAKSGYSGD